MAKHKTLNQLMAARMRYRHENGAAMMLALVIMMLTTVVSIVVASFAFTSITASRGLANFTDANAALQTGIANALLQANAPDSVQKGSYNLNRHQANSCKDAAAVTGTTSDASSTFTMKWNWYSQKVILNGGVSAWNIYVAGYAADNSCDSQTARKVRITLSPLTAQTACYSDAARDGACLSATAPQSSDSVIASYQTRAGAVFSNGILGTSGVTIGSSANTYPKIYAYSAQQKSNPVANDDLGDSTVATNNGLNLYSKNTSLDLFNQYQGAACTVPAGGDTDACDTLNTQSLNYKATLETLDASSAAACAAPAAAWKASGGQPLVNGVCYSGITFDADYTASTSTVVKVYTNAAITVNQGVKVNALGAPANLQIIALKGVSGCTLNAATASNASTVFRGYIGGSSLACTDTAASGRLTIYGALAARTVSLRYGGTTMWQDDDARAGQTCQLTSSDLCRELWQITDYRSLN